MKLNKLLVGFSIIGLIFVTGCSQNNSNRMKNNNSEINKLNMKIVGNTFKGTYSGTGTSKDPNYEYLMHFYKDGTFRQDIISTKGYSGKFVELGEYDVNSDNTNIKINIKKVVETSYKNNVDLKQSNNPILYSFRTKNGDTKLTESENKSIDIKIKKNYLLGTVNNVKLYKTKDELETFNSFKEVQEQKYQKVKEAQDAEKAKEEAFDNSDAGQLAKQVKNIDPSLKVTNESNIDIRMATKIFDITVGVDENTTWVDTKEMFNINDSSVISHTNADGSYQLYFQGGAYPSVHRYGDVAIYGFIEVGPDIDPTQYEKQIIDLKIMKVIGTTDIAPTHIHDNE